jgi:quercetin dioxygenase-like cupin family protein
MHSHDEYEIFVALTGQATLIADRERTPFAAGDIAHLPPGSRHYVVGSDGADFEFYAIWWNTELSREFVARHDSSGPVR